MKNYRLALCSILVTSAGLTGCGGGADTAATGTTTAPVTSTANTTVPTSNPPATATPPAISPSVAAPAPATSASPAPTTPSLTPAGTTAPSPTPAPLANVDVKLANNFPVTEAACGASTTSIEANGALTYAIWLNCNTGALPISVRVDPQISSVTLTYGSTASGSVVYTIRGAANQVSVDTVTKTIKVVGLTIPKDSQTVGLNGAQLTGLPEAVLIDATLKLN
jgi:hypothetical protein